MSIITPAVTEPKTIKLKKRYTTLMKVPSIFNPDLTVKEKKTDASWE